VALLSKYIGEEVRMMTAEDFIASREKGETATKW